jgi:2-polyprenyl-6-methoxyphenol hydroxylase-like FAD-dependent oxidoreductase
MNDSADRAKASLAKGWYVVMVEPVVIVGAGIGGLTLANALRRRRLPFVVLEGAAELTAAGAGITVQPNAMRALGHLGLAERVREAGCSISRVSILNRRGRRLGPETDLGELARQHGYPAIALHRARLHEVLMAGVADAVRLGARVVGVADDEGGVRAVLASDEEVAGACVIGADGARSAVRAHLIGDGEPRYAGYTSWRGIAPASAAPGVGEEGATESWGRGARFGIVPIGHGEIYWYATANAPPGVRDGDVGVELRERFGGWHRPVAALLEATPAARILRTDITDRDPVRPWHRGRIVLLGDAAHPMTPNFGQGACQAIEDALILDECLAPTQDHAAAFARYEARRFARTRAIVMGSRRLGAIAQWSNPVAAWLRDTGVRLTPAWVTRRNLRKVLTFDLGGSLGSGVGA